MARRPTATTRAIAKAIIKDNIGASGPGNITRLPTLQLLLHTRWRARTMTYEILQHWADTRRLLTKQRRWKGTRGLECRCSSRGRPCGTVSAKSGPTTHGSGRQQRFQYSVYICSGAHLTFASCRWFALKSAKVAAEASSCGCSATSHVDEL